MPKPDLLTEVEAAMLVGMSPTLLRWLTSYAPKSGDSRKLAFVEEKGAYFYSKEELLAFDEYLRQPWPPVRGARPTIPTGILFEVKSEAGFQCAFCGHGNDGEAAHIEPVSKSFSNHPHNLIWSCPNHHTAFDHGHKIHATLKASDVVAKKKELLERQHRYWRTEIRLADSLLTMLSELSNLENMIRDAKSIAALEKARAAAKATVKRIRDRVHAPRVAEIDLAVRLGPATVASQPNAAKALVDVGDEYVATNRLKPCPLCKGGGSYRQYDICPGCGGDAFLSDDDIRSIDTSAFDQVQCVLCSGSGDRNGSSCPECGGEGRLERRFAQQINWSDYKFVKCPLCKGTGIHKHEQCPICENGEIERGRLERIDLSQYREVKCRLCKGSGEGPHGGSCRACDGAGSLPAYVSDQADWSQWEEDEESS